MQNRPIIWDDRLDARLKELAQDTSLSRMDIAIAMGLTKNQVVGRLFRLGMCVPANDPVPFRTPRPKFVAPPPPPPTEPPKRVQGGCRYIAGEVVPGMTPDEIEALHCNIEPKPGSSYCHEHHGVCYFTIPKRNKRRKPEHDAIYIPKNSGSIADA